MQFIGPAMAKRESERYGSMSELAAALSEYLRRGSPCQSSSTTVEPVVSESKPSRPDDTETSGETVARRDAVQSAGQATGQVNESPVNVLAPTGLLTS